MIQVESSRITTDSWKGLAWILRVGSRISLMQLSETARYKAYILIYGQIYAEHLDITDCWKDLARILTVGSRISHIQPAPEFVSCILQTLNDLQRIS